MAEFTQNAETTVLYGDSLPFSETAVPGNGCTQHREGSGQVTLRGVTNKCYVPYLVIFSGNITVPTGGTPGQISIAIAINNEALRSATAIATPAAAGDYSNVAVATEIRVPRGSSVTVSMVNNTPSTGAINVQNGNLIVLDRRNKEG